MCHDKQKKVPHDKQKKVPHDKQKKVPPTELNQIDSRLKVKTVGTK